MKDIFIERTEAPEKNAEVVQNFTFYSTDKYTHDLYYISPLYHLEFPPQLKRVIVTDLDLEFRIDLSELWGHFSKFSATELISIANDLHPHYFINTREYRETHPGTHVGSPGRFQVVTGISTKCSIDLLSLTGFQLGRGVVQPGEDAPECGVHRGGAAGQHGGAHGQVDTGL